MLEQELSLEELADKIRLPYAPTSIHGNELRFLGSHHLGKLLLLCNTTDHSHLPFNIFVRNNPLMMLADKYNCAYYSKITAP